MRIPVYRLPESHFSLAKINGIKRKPFKGV